MSHLIIEQGKEVGREIMVPQTGIKFGRSPANDLVLDDEVVMLFQGRFFFKSDGTLWITDFSVGEKARLDGEPIDEEQLKVGDLVEVGSSAFRVISTRREGSGVVPAADAPAQDEIDLGFKPSKPARSAHGAARESVKHASPVYRLLQMAVIILLLLLVVVGATELMGARDRSGGRSEKRVAFVYECVRGDTENIFRYALELTPDGKASIEVDDCRSRHVSKRAQLSAEDLENLSRRLAGSRGFFKINNSQEGNVPGQYELYDLALTLDGDFNHVRLLNRQMPPDLRQTIAIIEDFAFEALDVSYTLMEDDASLIRYAQEAVRLGEERYAERDSAYGNLAKAIMHFNESITYLQTMEPRPDPYDKAMRLLEQARQEQDKRYKDYMFNVERAMRLGDWAEAKRQLRVLAELIPDRSDERFDAISSKQLEVENKLR
ncbi:MAG TPA: FHA domain-containing protein [Pontiella sp.]|nr:FHA domain-containing protein [Pontiella sp.]